MMIWKRQKIDPHPLIGRHVFIPRMSTGGAEAMAAAFRSLGINADVSPQSDEETLPLAARFTTGEECLPQRVTLGNFLKVALQPDFHPAEIAFFLPTSSGPCRFGQYAPLLRKILGELGFGDTLVFSPTSSDGYKGIAGNANRFFRTAWRAIVVSDILRKLLMMFRPYELNKGDTDRLHDAILQEACAIISNGTFNLHSQMRQLVGILGRARERFLGIPIAEPLGSRPLVGAVGEIYLRFNSYSNQDIIRKIEALGGEVWIANISEWVWYTNVEEKRRLMEADSQFGVAMAKARIRHKIQDLDEKRLYKALNGLFENRVEPAVETILDYSRPYLPSHMALGEMTLNSGNAIAYYKAGCDGVVDISPFTCMNGIVTEVVYPKISRDYGNIPIRIFYFDGVPFDLDSDLEIFMEQVRSYRKKRLNRS